MEVRDAKYVISYGRCAIWCLFVSTIVQSIAGYARDATPFWKFIIAVFCWLGVFFCLRKVKWLKTLPFVVRFIINNMILLIATALFQSLLFGKVYSGQKIVVIFTNMYCLLDLIGVFFITAVTTFDDFKVLISVTKWMVPISVFILFFNYKVAVESYFLTYITIYSTIFLPYIKKRLAYTFIVGYLLSLFAFFGGGRQAALLLVFTFISIALPFFLNKKWTFLISIIIIVCPLVLVYYSINYESIFRILSMANNSSQYDVTDTRTFLWVELFDDFLRQPILIQFLGKGVVGYYSSDFFGTTHRLGIEVPCLQWIMQAGFAYVALFAIIVLLAIRNLYAYGNNKMSQCASILIAGYFFNCFVSNLVGCNISHLGFWMLIGLAFNRNILEMSDNLLKKNLR